MVWQGIGVVMVMVIGDGDGVVIVMLVVMALAMLMVAAARHSTAQHRATAPGFTQTPLPMDAAGVTGSINGTLWSTGLTGPTGPLAASTGA